MAADSATRLRRAASDEDQFEPKKPGLSVYQYLLMVFDIKDFTDIAQQFVQFYYQTFDANRQGLAPLYRDHSMLTFENSSVQGAGAITEKLGDLLQQSLPFQKVQHQIATFDAQPSSENGIIVLVTGALLVDEEQKPMNYTQLFKLQPDGAGSYFVLNDVFRLIYAAA
ncbi:hypothetical protein N7462_006470 [Penicillium macrosclerotiorum]|uniref:uncharacterized protein n=1 Tax=Penicillium macrosclerotiorum TaxID=303699 RepID=UPI002548B893|nr:uncharacterized protein N7462_006470 [Penicillium macrosclerotiorum]KAJ5683305.1 hypothetical protein N7462_006470 [Penicillium macrosclerotiorum]